MNREDKILLIKTLSESLPYGVDVELSGIRGRLANLDVTHYYSDGERSGNVPLDLEAFIDFFQPNEPINVTNFKPLLRDKSDLTNKELKDLQEAPNEREYLLSRHIDVSGLLSKDLAIKVCWDYYFDEDDMR